MQNHMENKVYAGFFVRLIAFVIDSLIAAIAVSAVTTPLSFAASGGADFLKANLIFHYSFLDVLNYVGVAVYFVLLTYFTHSTPGKAAMRLEVITVEKEWTIWNVIYRETVGRFFSSLLCIGYFAVLVSHKKQAFHDMLCDTYVVYKGVMPKTESVPVVPLNASELKVSAAEEASMENMKVESVPTEGAPMDNLSPQDMDDTSFANASNCDTNSVVEPPVYYTKPVTYNHDQVNPDCSNEALNSYTNL